MLDRWDHSKLRVEALTVAELFNPALINYAPVSPEAQDLAAKHDPLAALRVGSESAGT